MAKPANPKSFPVHDYDSAHTVFADDLVAIDDLGPVTHLIFAMAKREFDADRSGERLVVARIIIPTALRAQIARQLATDTTSIEGTVDHPDQMHAVH